MDSCGNWFKAVMDEGILDLLLLEKVSAEEPDPAQTEGVPTLNEEHLVLSPDLV